MSKSIVAGAIFLAETVILILLAHVPGGEAVAISAGTTGLQHVLTK